MQLEQLKHRLLQCISEQEDSLRIYRMTQSRERYLWTFGQQHDIDYDAPLII
jgi:CRISPR-associated protein Cas2